MEDYDLKIIALNGATLTLSMTEMETVLKIVLLLVSIGFTIARWYDIHKKNKINK
jgi:phosphatidylglycerophosphatase A